MCINLKVTKNEGEIQRTGFLFDSPTELPLIEVCMLGIGETTDSEEVEFMYFQWCAKKELL
jgi:hypothetical protein